MFLAMTTMADTISNLNSSLPVPSIQELAIQNPDQVPPRYIRDDDVDDEIGAFPSGSSLHVPLIDMAKLVNAETRSQELQNLHLACADSGVFRLVVNHGVSDESLAKMRDQVERFFELPFKEKMRYAQRPGSLEGYGQAFVTSENQKLDWNDMIFLKTQPIQNRNLDLWPQNPPLFRESLVRYSEEMREMTSLLVKFICMALGVEASKLLLESFKEGQFDIRMNCFPPCPEPERVLGIVPHADISAITLLLECGHLPGLQFLKDEKWIFVKPIDGTIVVVIGQIFEVMSNGIYKAPVHRAVVNKLKERLTIVTFCYPSPLVDIGPFKDLIDEKNRPLYKTMTNAEYFHRFYNRKLEESFIDTLKL